MICQDITRLVDSGKFSALTDSERRSVDAHAQTCRHCAPMWMMHAHLAGEQPPRMPRELSVRCMTLAAAPSSTGEARHTSRRLMVTVGSVIALAAAASLLLVKVANAPAPEGAPAVLLPTVDVPVIPVQPEGIATEPTADSSAPAGSSEPSSARTSGAIPKFPPQVAAEKAFAVRRNLALDKLVELYPALTQPQPDGTIAGAVIGLREDGRVFVHGMQFTREESWPLVRDELDRLLPEDGGEGFGDFAPRGSPVPANRTLGVDLRFNHLLVRNTYDPARSDRRVDEIMRAQRPDLMLAPTESGGSHVIVLLSSTGAIQREVARFINRDEVQEMEKWSAADRARAMARTLGVSENEIGIMGRVPVYDNPTRRVMLVDYAWQRLPGETAPQYQQIGWDRFQPQGIDVATALEVVERVMPDAFMGVDVEIALGIPTILLSEQGEFIRTGRTKADPRNTFPGISIATFRMLVLKNGTGDTSAVYFVWQGTPRAPEPPAMPASTNR